MNVGRILKEIPGCIVTIAVVGGVIYTIGALFVIKVQDTYFHDFRGTIQVREIKLGYGGVEPYDSWVPWRWQDKNGYAEVNLRGNERVFLRYEDLTSLEGRIMVKDSEGKDAEFNEKSKYDRKTLEDVSNSVSSPNLG